MQTLKKIAATVGVVGAIAASSSVSATADWYYGHHHRGYGYYNYYNPDPHCTYAGCCPRGFTVQGGVCKPYQGPRGPFAPLGSRFWWQ
jgi:hypothetical protein